MKRSISYPSSKAEEDLCVESLDFPLLVLNTDDPFQHAGVFAAKDSSFTKIGSIHAKSVQGSHNLPSPPNLEIFQIVQGGQRLGEIDLDQILREAPAHEAGDEAWRERAWL